MIIKTLIVGMLQENCYIVMNQNSNEGFIIDPGDEVGTISKKVEELGCDIKGILLTHGHMDHVGAVVGLKDKYNVPVYMNAKEYEFMKEDTFVYIKLPEIFTYIEEGTVLNIAGLEIKAIHTPGHTKGGMCFLIGEDLFTGDTLFQGSVGRSDFIGGDGAELIRSIKEKLLDLGDNIKVYPGHGPSSTIGFEKARNPYLQEMDGFSIW